MHLHDERDGSSPLEDPRLIAILLHVLPKRVLQRSVRELKTLALGRSQEFARQRLGHVLHLRPREPRQNGLQLLLVANQLWVALHLRGVRQI